jgi:hypothetical protein
MRHFDILCAKYGIDEQQQTQGIFTETELEAWLQGYAISLAPAAILAP